MNSDPPELLILQWFAALFIVEVTLLTRCEGRRPDQEIPAACMSMQAAGMAASPLSAFQGCGI